jgi:hypothetical protein
MNEKKIRTNIYLTAEVHAFFKERAEQGSSTVSGEINFALRKYMNEVNYMERDLPKFLEIAETLGLKDANDLLKIIELYKSAK